MDMQEVHGHGRSLNQAMQVPKDNPDVYVDTAFMLLDHIARWRKNVSDEKILFGTDISIGT